MDLVETGKRVMVSAGAGWVLWLLIALSIFSVAIMLERGLVFFRQRDDVDALRHQLRNALRSRGLTGARKVMQGSPHPGAQVVLRGIETSEWDESTEHAEEAMAAEVMAQKRRLERRLSVLGTLGANAPFIGLLGTVIGIVQAFDALGAAKAASAGAAAPTAVMSSLAEALVATAVGIAVAIPAVFAFNSFQKQAKEVLNAAEMLARDFLAHADVQQRSSSASPEPAE